MGDNCAAAPGGGGPTGSHDMHRTRHDMSQDGLDVTIAIALGEATDLTPTEVISNFSKYADPDALNRLFRVPDGQDSSRFGQMTLRIEGHTVEIASDGTVEIHTG